MLLKNLKNPSWAWSRTVDVRRRFETAVPGVVTGYDPSAFSKVQKRWPIAGKNI
jgi:hypothetical protein